MKMFSNFSDCYNDEEDLYSGYQRRTNLDLNNLDDSHRIVASFFPHNGSYLTKNPADMVLPDFTNTSHCVQSTAASKDSIFKVEVDSDVDGWKVHDVQDWTSSDVLHWIAHISEEKNFPPEEVNAQAFSINGAQLSTFSLKDFIQLDSTYGRVLFESLQKHIDDRTKLQNNTKMDSMTISSSYMTLLSSTKPTANHHSSYTNYTNYTNYQTDSGSMSDNYPFSLDHPDKKPELPQPPAPAPQSILNHNSPQSSTSSSDEESTGFDKQEENVKSKKGSSNKRPPGRPPGVKTKKDKPEKKNGRLWEFIRDLLLDPQYCPSLICWENHDDGVFRFVKSDKVAKIWGTRKSNEKMTYEKLSRAMRYYYKSKVFQPVLGRRLVYKFGPTAKGWRTDNPNFKNKQNSPTQKDQSSTSGKS